jgi:hypothetical protein
VRKFFILLISVSVAGIVVRPGTIWGKILSKTLCHLLSPLNINSDFQELFHVIWMIVFWFIVNEGTCSIGMHVSCLFFSYVHEIVKCDYQLGCVCPSAWNNWAATGQIPMKSDTWVFLKNLSRKFKFD